MGQEKKRKFIFNETPDSRGADIPKGYDGKILGSSYQTIVLMFNQNLKVEHTQLELYCLTHLIVCIKL